MDHKKSWIFILFFAIYSAQAADLPIGKIYAAGLTFKKHIKDAQESVSKDGPPIFLKHPRTLLFAESRKDVRIPADSTIYAELDRVEPGLAAKVQDKFEDGFPLMFDYEAEIGIYFTRAVKKSELSGASLKNAVALFSSNDLTLRSFQVLGDGRKNVYDFWSAGKSFQHFLPYSSPKAVSDFPLNAWMNLAVRLWVNGQIRQNETTADMAYTPRKVLETLVKYTGDTIPAGTVFILGTPTGTAFKLSWFKKLMAGMLFWARMLKFQIAANSAEKDPNYLKAGDEVIVEVPNVGQNRIRIVD